MSSIVVVCLFFQGGTPNIFDYSHCLKDLFSFFFFFRTGGGGLQFRHFTLNIFFFFERSILTFSCVIIGDSLKNPLFSSQRGHYNTSMSFPSRKFQPIG